jgi:hypothetical protein
MPSRHTYPAILDTNAYLRKASESFFFQCTTRTVQESKLFPVNPYIALSYYNAWYRWPELLRKIDAAMPAEEIGDRARQVGSYVNTITMGLIPQFYLGGRQFLMDMGMLKPTDALDDVMDVLDFGRRVNQSMHRSHAHIFPSDAGHRAQIHTARQTDHFDDLALGVTPGDRLHTAFNKFMATVSAYGFLSHCECRLSFNNHGPYKVDGGHEMLVRDILDLAECDYPWMDGVAAPIEHNNITVTVTMKDTHFSMVDDWGSFEAVPSYDAANLVAVGVYTSDHLSDGYIPVHMENADDLADYLEELHETLSATTAGMWKMMAGWNRTQMVEAGLLVYSGVAKDLAHFAGVYEQSDWFDVDDQCRRMYPLMNDEYGGGAIAELVGLLSLTTQNNSPHHMEKYTNGRGEMWTPIPYSVLSDDEWTSTVGPIGPGGSELAPKTALYTTTRGKLTQEENNQAARDFRPGGWELRHFDDDTHVKFNPEDPRHNAMGGAAESAAPTGA